MARYEAGHAAAAKERILAGAATMIRERGLDGASVSEVMKAAGLTVGGFYAHFDDKTEMLASATRAAFAATLDRFHFLASKAVENGDAGLIARHYLSSGRVSNPGDGCAAAALASEMHRAPEPVRAAFVEGASKAAAALAPATGRDPGTPDWATLSLIVGALALMRAAPESGTHDAIRSAAEEALRRLATPAGRGEA